jgi:hypothetical protein
MITRHKLALGLLGSLLVASILGFLIFMYPITFVDAWNSAVGFSWSGNHTLTLYIYAHCYPYYLFSSQCFTRFGVVGTHFVGGSCTLEYVISTVVWWNNITMLIYYCTNKPTAVVINAMCGSAHFSNYSIAINNGTRLVPFMC